MLQIFLRFRIQIYDLTYYEQMNPVVAKKAMTVWQDAYPSRCCCPFHIVVNGKKMTVTCLIQAQSNAFCQHATSNRECLSDDAGQIRQFFFNFDEIITLSKPIHQNVFLGGRLTT